MRGALRTYTMRSYSIIVTLLVALPACQTPPDDFGIDGPLDVTEPMGKEDNAGRPGPLVANNTSATQVWTAKNRWEDRDTTDARKAGMAWPADSGLNWDEKFARWVESL